MDDDKDTVVYDVLATDEMIAATGVTVGEDGMREALLVTYTKNDGANSELLFQQQVAGVSADAAEATEKASQETEPIAQIVTTGAYNEEEYAYSLAAADAGSVVVAGASGSQYVASASVSKYTVSQSADTDTSSGAATGNPSVSDRRGRERDPDNRSYSGRGSFRAGYGDRAGRGVQY